MNMCKTQKSRRPGLDMLLMAAVYFVSYLTRNSYNVVIAELVRETGLSQSALALCVTGSLIAYGGGKIVFGGF